MEEFQPLHVVATVGAMIIGIGTAIFLVNILMSWRFGPQAKEDPWDADKNNMPDFLGEYLNKADVAKPAVEQVDG